MESSDFNVSSYQINILCHFSCFLYQVEFNLFVDHSSAAEVGTSRASVNRTGKTNAAKGVDSNYNEYKEFHQREVEAHICASFMEMTGMKTFDGTNNLLILLKLLSKLVKRIDQSICPNYYLFQIFLCF